MRRLLLLASTALLTCSSPSAPGSLRVLVNVEPGVGSRCARLIARGTTQRESSPVLLAGRTSFVIGIAQDGESEDVLLQARGFSDEGCTTLSVPAENSELLPARFGAPTPAVMLTLRLPQGGIDADGDTFFAGLDCDDEEALINPAATESCLNGLDDDCDGTRDCADSDCAGLGCGVLGQCANGVCVAPSEAGLCADGLDNDGDGDVDCSDGDCPAGVACSDANACTRGEVCSAAGCVGVAVTCNQPPSGQCFAGAGTCLPDSGCSYPVRTGSCDDQDNCTRGDACDASGRCSGTRVTCTPPGECFTATGCSSSGGCLFSVRSGSCSGGACNGAGACVQATPGFPFTPTNFTTSQLPPSAGAVVISCDVTIDTQSGGWSTCQGGPAAPEWRVVGSSLLLYFDSLKVNSGVTVRAVGERSLIIAVRGAAEIDGTLTVSSDGLRGAGSELSCGGGVGGDGRASGNPETAGGGGGGGFGSRGGRGGDGDHGGSNGDRGDENGHERLSPLRGGCRGGAGGRAEQGFGAGGRGGGALQLSAGTIELNSGSTLSAQGEGGRGGLALSRIGGGGGGSGGAIFLEANTLSIDSGAAVVANGGAGGEGSGLLSGGDGQHGQRSTARAADVPLTCGGDGGNGAARSGSAGNASEPSCGSNFAGGGGGGGVGRVRFEAHDDCPVSEGALLSPEPRTDGRCH